MTKETTQYVMVEPALTEFARQILLDHENEYRFVQLEVITELRDSVEELAVIPTDKFVHLLWKIRRIKKPDTLNCTEEANWVKTVGPNINCSLLNSKFISGSSAEGASREFEKWRTENLAKISIVHLSGWIKDPSLGKNPYLQEVKYVTVRPYKFE